MSVRRRVKTCFDPCFQHRCNRWQDANFCNWPTTTIRTSMTWPVGSYRKSWTAPVASGTAASPAACRPSKCPGPRSSTPRPARRKPRSSPWQPACGAATATRSWPRTGGSTSFPAARWTASCGPGGASSNSAGRSAAATPRTSASTRSSSRSTRPRPWARSSAPAQIKNANMVCNVDYLTIEAWIRQRLNSPGRALRWRSRPEALPGRRLQVPHGRPAVRQGSGRAQRRPWRTPTLRSATCIRKRS